MRWVALVLGILGACGVDDSPSHDDSLTAPEILAAEPIDPAIWAEPMCGVAGQTMALVQGSGWADPTRFCDYHLYFDGEEIGPPQTDGFYGPPAIWFTVPEGKEPGWYRLEVKLIQREPYSLQACAYIWFLVLKLDRVEWVDPDGQPPTLSPNPPDLQTAIPPTQRAALAGRRYFPDAEAFDEPRRLVNVRATLSAECPGVPIYFKSFDPDDGGATGPPVRVVRTCDDGVTVACDNRGEPRVGVLYPAPAHGFPTTVETDAMGEATVTFKTSMHPGDNYLVAASANPLELSSESLTVDHFQLRDAFGNLLPNEFVKATPMLTVWRYLNLELDSMENPTHIDPTTGASVRRNLVSGTVVGSALNTVFGAKTGFSYCVFTIDPTLLGSSDNEYDKGLFSVGTRELKVLSVNRTSGAFEFWPGLPPNQGSTVRTSLPDLTFSADMSDEGTDLCPSSGPFELHDDDLDLQFPTHPELSYVNNSDAVLENSDDPAKNRLAVAFIRPVHVGGAQDVTWISHVNEAEIWDYVAPWKNCRSDQHYWCAYLQDAFQSAQPSTSHGVLRKDRDPDNSRSFTYGVTWSPGLHGMRADEPRTGAFIFGETIYDVFMPHSQYAARRRRTALHELGHLLLACHGDSGIMCYPSIQFGPDGVVASVPPLSTNQLVFTPDSINKIRWLEQPSKFPNAFRMRRDESAWDGPNSETLPCGESTQCL